MKCFAKASLAVVLLLAAGCGLPVNQMTAKERKADMQWAFTVFNHNYAPAELKKSNFGVEISQVEADCVTMAEEEMDNQAFLALFQKCIHSFKDAHVGGQQMNNGLLPEYAQVAHLGFITMRTKSMVDGQKMNALRLVAPLKGSDTPGAPLVPGDLIIRVDGKNVGDYLMQEVVPFIDVGQDETSLTAAAFRFGVRTSIDMGLPEADEIELVVARGPMVFTIVIPWIKEDLLTFQLKQNPPEENPPPELTQPSAIASASASIETVEDVLNDFETGLRPANLAGMEKNPLAHTFLGYREIKKLLNLFDAPLEYAANRLKFVGLTGYQLSKFNPVMKALFDSELDQGNKVDEVLKNRQLPMSSIVEDLMSEPLFTAKTVVTNDGKKYAYVQLKNFPAEDKILTEWYRMITAIEDKGIKALIIDLVDNGGGSLVHGMRMLNMTRQKPLKYPSMQVRLNNNWVNTFKSQAAFSENDYQKAIAGRVVSQLEDDMAAGKKLSRPISITVMDPFFLQNPTIGLSDDVKIAILVNEMCVSMCDIFASGFQENQMGLVVGQRTMGGGGNVVQHGLSPVSKIGMALTESLIITSGGQYIEDAGVTPDTLVDMVGDREKGFPVAFKAAYDYIMGPN